MSRGVLSPVARSLVYDIWCGCHTQSVCCCAAAFAQVFVTPTPWLRRTAAREDQSKSYHKTQRFVNTSSPSATGTSLPAPEVCDKV